MSFGTNDPHTFTGLPGDIVSFTVPAPNAWEADRFATGAFAMGAAGIEFIEKEPCLEAT